MERTILRKGFLPLAYVPKLLCFRQKLTFQELPYFFGFNLIPNRQHQDKVIGTTLVMTLDLISQNLSDCFKSPYSFSAITSPNPTRDFVTKV